MPDYKYREIAEKIIGAARKIHSAPANGFREVIYQRALKTELGKAGLCFERGLTMPVMVGIKATMQSENVHRAQAKNYPEAYYMQVDLSTNFRGISLRCKRLEHAKFVDRILPINL